MLQWRCATHVRDSCYCWLLCRNTCGCNLKIAVTCQGLASGGCYVNVNAVICRRVEKSILHTVTGYFVWLVWQCLTYEIADGSETIGTHNTVCDIFPLLLIMIGENVALIQHLSAMVHSWQCLFSNSVIFHQVNWVAYLGRIYLLITV